MRAHVLKSSHSFHNHGGACSTQTHVDVRVHARSHRVSAFWMGTPQLSGSGIHGVDRVWREAMGGLGPAPPASAGRPSRFTSAAAAASDGRCRLQARASAGSARVGLLARLPGHPLPGCGLKVRLVEALAIGACRLPARLLAFWLAGWPPVSGGPMMPPRVCLSEAKPSAPPKTPPGRF